MHYQHLRVQCDTKAGYILFIACLTFDVDIQYQLFIVYWSLHCFSHLIILIPVYIRCDVIAVQYEIYSTANYWY